MISPLIALIVWMVLSPMLFLVFPARRAVLALFVGGWLVLPKGSFALPGVPDLSPALAIAVGTFAGITLFDPGAWFRYRFRWVDAIVAVLVITPLFSSLVNNLGLYDGLSASLSHAVKWGAPYLAGRMYINSRESVIELCSAIAIGALCYIPLCLWEIRMSPQLNNQLYGFIPFSFITTWRFGAYRPVVFLSHGIELGMLMLVASVCGIALWRSKSKRTLMGVPVSWAAIALVIMLVISRALGGWVLFILLAMAFIAIRVVRVRVLVMLFVLMPAIYVGARITDLWNGQGVVDVASVVSETRAKSLQSRLYHDRRLKDRALEQPIFGWGGWGRQRIRDIEGKDQSVTDAMWIIIFGQNGFLGLLSWLGMMILPGVLAVRRASVRLLMTPAFYPVTALIMLLPILMTDLMLNAFIGPAFIMISGALVSLLPLIEQAQAAEASSVARRRQPPAVAGVHALES